MAFDHSFQKKNGYISLFKNIRTVDSENELKAFSIRELSPKEKKTINCIFDRGHSCDFCRLSALKLIQMAWCAMEHMK